ncbi:MAG: hypothetical protein IKN43_01870 [Selenomonadaceae bacterium]|nr:hypothetical protein [Selenomonadaceae bacterium]
MKIMKILRCSKKKFAYIVVGLVVFVFLDLFVLSKSAAYIFNMAMEQQEMLLGKITVEEIYGSINGKTTFKGLRWDNLEGETILYVPEGVIGVKPFDILRGKFEADTIYKIELKNARLFLNMDDNMNLDFVTKKEDSENRKENKVDEILAAGTEEERLRLSKLRRKKEADEFAGEWRNFHHENRDIYMKFNLEDCPVSILYKGKHYYLSAVNVTSEIDSNSYMKFRISTGRFGGNMRGGAISLRGDITWKDDEPIADISALFQDIDIASLGIMDNQADSVTLEAYFSGPVADLEGDGVIKMDKLTLPNLPFTNVRGDFVYKGGLFTFKKLHADVFEGELNASGDFHMDTRYYHIHGVAKNLSAKSALPKDKLITKVDANLHMVANENSRNMAIWGNFVGSPGSYDGIPFDKVTANFTNSYRDLRFFNAKIDVGYYTLKSDFIGIKDGKLTLDPVILEDIRTGKERMRYVRENKG